MGRPTSLKAKIKEPLPIARVAAAHIAHRFAPRPQPALASQAPRVEQPAQSFPAFGVSPRILIAALAGLALLPNLTVAVFLWWPSQQGEPPQPAAPAVKVASLAKAPIPEARAAEPAKVSPVLTAPSSLEASANASIDLPIALDGTDGVPARSSVAISGLPDGATLSTGRPYGAGGWNLKSDEIGDLRLNLPDSSRGEAKLAIELVAPHGEILAKAETLLKMTPAPEGEPASLPNEGVAALEVAAAAGPAAMPDLKPVPLEANEDAQGSAQDAESKPRLVSVQPIEAPEPAADPKPSPASAAKPMALAAADPAPDAQDAETVTPSMYVNLRERPTSSAPVLGVIPKGTKLAVQDRSRGWVQVTHPTTSQVGWIYDGTHWAPRHARRAAKPAASEESFWTRLGRTLAGSSAAESEQN